MDDTKSINLVWNREYSVVRRLTQWVLGMTVLAAVVLLLLYVVVDVNTRQAEKLDAIGELAPVPNDFPIAVPDISRPRASQGNWKAAQRFRQLMVPWAGITLVMLIVLAVFEIRKSRLMRLSVVLRHGLEEEVLMATRDVQEGREALVSNAQKHGISDDQVFDQTRIAEKS